jgi:hypothetical protein
MSLRIFLPLFLIVFSIPSSWAQRSFNYIKPLETAHLVESSKLSLSDEEKEKLAVLLCTAAKISATNLKFNKKTDPLLPSKCVALAQDLASDAKSVMVTNYQLGQGVVPNVPADASAVEKISNNLYQQAISLVTNGNAENKTLACYIFELAAVLNPLNDDAVYQMTSSAQNGFHSAWQTKLVDNNSNSKPAIPDNPTTTTTDSSKERSSIKILLVNSLNTGQEIGATNNLIGVQQKAAATNISTSFSGSVGTQMNIATEEATRLANVKHPNLSSGCSIKLSFEDKYTPKDGGSCGTAVAVLLLSLVDNFDIDQTGVITGDITVDGLVQKIGGVFAKTEGAISSGAKFMVLPSQNTTDIDDYFVMHPVGDALKIQIFSADNIDDATALMKIQKSDNLAKAMELYSALVSSPQAQNLRNPDVLKQLQEIVQLAPNHLSAKILLRSANGSLPRKMSVPNSIDQIFMAAAPLLPYLAKSSENTGTLPIYPQEVSDKCLQQLNTLNFKVNQKTAGLQDAFLSYIQELQVLANSGKGRDLSGNTTYNPRFQPVLDARARIYSEIRSLQYDKSVLEDYFRKDSDSSRKSNR